MTLDLLSALLIGLLGSGHCFGMCGAISTSLAAASGANQIRTGFAYNVGRILSYTLIGAIVGFSSSIAVSKLGVPLTLLRLFSGLFLIFLALYLMKLTSVLVVLEKLGHVLWRHIQPLTKR